VKAGDDIAAVPRSQPHRLPDRTRKLPLGRLKDRVRPPVRVLLVGINPGVRSAAIGHHFAGHSNRFWKLLFDSRLVPEQLRAEEDIRLPSWGYGITNLIPRCTPGIDTLAQEEYIAGERRLRRKVRRWRPEVVAFLGVTLFRAVFSRRGLPEADRRRPGSPVSLGIQPEQFEGATVFVLPNPSGRNANYSYAQMLEAFVALRQHLGGPADPTRRSP
jgi:TDG/mug DNA glycosylase family protein